jgi:hypothetical protein
MRASACVCASVRRCVVGRPAPAVCCWRPQLRCRHSAPPAAPAGSGDHKCVACAGPLSRSVQVHSLVCLCTSAVVELSTAASDTCENHMRAGRTRAQTLRRRAAPAHGGRGGMEVRGRVIYAGRGTSHTLRQRTPHSEGRQRCLCCVHARAVAINDAVVRVGSGGGGVGIGRPRLVEHLRAGSRLPSTLTRNRVARLCECPQALGHACPPAVVQPW